MKRLSAFLITAFSVENAVCLFCVDGRRATMKVINPDTLNEIDRLELR